MKDHLILMRKCSSSVGTLTQSGIWTRAAAVSGKPAGFTYWWTTDKWKLGEDQTETWRRWINERRWRRTTGGKFSQCWVGSLKLLSFYLNVFLWHFHHLNDVLYAYVCVSMFVCVCMWESERERDRSIWFTLWGHLLFLEWICCF